MIKGITVSTGLFMIILVVTYIGFTFAFYILYDARMSKCSATNSTCEFEEPYGMGSVWDTFFTGWLLILGDFDAGEFDSSGR